MKKTYIKRKQTKRRRKTRKLRGGGGLFNKFKNMFSSSPPTNETAKAAEAKAAENAKVAANAKAAANTKAAANAKAANANPPTITTNATTEKSWFSRLMGR